MGLTKFNIGDLVEPYKIECGILALSPAEVSGISAEKEFFEPAKQVGSDTSKYKVVPSGYFACNLMHVGRDRVLPIALNRTENKKYVSPAYSIFKVNSPNVLPTYLAMFFNSCERDRYFWFHTDASVRDGMSWNDFCECAVYLPSISIQRKYSAIYEALLSNHRSYKHGLDDLRLTCQATIEQLHDRYPLHPIGNFIKTINEKNIDGLITLEQGVNIEKRFITPQRSNSNLRGRKIVRKGQFAYCTQLNNENVAIAYRRESDCVVSSVYEVFEIARPDELVPGYLELWLIRPEFGRYVYWASVGSAYEFLSFESIANYEIPIPPIAVQQSVADIYSCFRRREEIARELKEKLKDICPVLIRGSIEEASR